MAQNRTHEKINISFYITGNIKFINNILSRSNIPDTCPTNYSGAQLPDKLLFRQVENIEFQQRKTALKRFMMGNFHEFIFNSISQGEKMCQKRSHGA